jgi:RNA polymerase sigma-70 factor (ECF subfamily)
MYAIKLASDSPAQLSDQQVVARVLGGEKGLYEILMRRYNQRLYRTMRGYLTEPSDVQDAMQDTYVKAYEKLFQYRHEAAFSTWLIRIGINEALQRLKRIRSARKHFDPDVRTEGLIQLPDTPMTGPEERTIQQEERAMLERAIARLPETYRVVYLLREVEGLDVADVAEALAISESNVKVRAHRAKALLKDALFDMQPQREAFTFGNAHCDALVLAVMARI